MSEKAFKTQYLYEKLCAYPEKNIVPMHMPGHKRNFGFGNSLADKYDSLYNIDITEIEGFDNLHHPTGIIADMQKDMKDIYGSGASYVLVNGSSGGILAAISAAAARYRSSRKKSGRCRIIISRNCHKSVYNALYLNDLDAAYLLPAFDAKMGIWGKIEPEKLEKLLDTPNKAEDICGVVITSPTYEGIVSDIKELSRIAHRHEIPLIVDSAHGAHFYFHEDFPQPALINGADVVVESLHKTLPALTQTAVLHLGRESLIGRQLIERYTDIYQSTSPSYILMASVSRCMEFVQKEREKFADFAGRLKCLREKIKELSNIRIYPCDDISKLVIFSPYLKGTEIYDILLHTYNIQIEMASQHYGIAMTTVCDSQENFDKLFTALEQMDKMVQGRQSNQLMNLFPGRLPKAAMGFMEALESHTVEVPLLRAEGRISGEHILAYPPGSPVIAAGEVFDREIIQLIDKYIQMGIEVIGVAQGYVRVVDFTD